MQIPSELLKTVSLQDIKSSSFPICNGTYSNQCDVTDVDFLKGICLWVNEHIYKYRALFGGLCYHCNTSWPPVQRCGGCQLVTYCSKFCQKADRSTHKYVCKEFPVVNANNVLHTTGPWKEHIAGLRERAARLPQAEIAAKPIFRNPRVCHTCREARQDRLTDCKCTCVSYCNKRCAKADKPHKEYCRDLALIAQSYIWCYREDLPSLRDTPEFEKLKHSLNLEYLSYPNCLMYALISLPGHRLGLGHDSWPLQDYTTLNIHVVTSSPQLSSVAWEASFMHKLPKLKQLNVVFIMQGKTYKPSFFHNLRLSGLSLKRCKDCEANNCVITYSVQQMPYHMYFSSTQYTEPDVVVIYGNTHDMPVSEEDAIHSEISYRNMTYSRETVLVLADATEDLVKQGIRAVNAAQPVDQLVAPKINLFMGFSSQRADLDSHAAISNDRYCFTCLRSKDSFLYK